MKFDPFFNDVFTPQERMEMFAEVQREADLDALNGKTAQLSRAVDRRCILGLVVNEAAAELRRTGSIDWRAVCAALVTEAGGDVDVSAEALERLVRAYAEPGAAATGTDK